VPNMPRKQVNKTVASLDFGDISAMFIYLL